MAHPHIALIGKARSGKDTVATAFIRHAYYTRVAFGDEVKVALIRLDPYVSAPAPRRSTEVPIRLADIIRSIGWERAKDVFPEVRRLLQEYGQAVRELDPEFWVRPALARVRQGTQWNMPCVVTDVRYANELDALREEGAVVVRVERPGAGLAGDAGAHESETELDGVTPDHVLHNGGTLAQLRASVRDLYTSLGG
ncbi:hypothetical protein [Streptomyces sp. NPDC045369]|uniref:deoxynucleotide monophosphate kinase family protein n=1 Tax=Streptomyces sp. NPDC045369 TaxID=3155732 RepID=UPI003407AE99